MAILVDYACGRCTGRSEIWAASPPPPTAPCPACGAQARRVWAAVGKLSGPSERPRVVESGSSTPLCVTNPDVPGLCHMSPSAGRAWVARARRDNRALDRELERQERAGAVNPPSLNDVVAHGHNHEHVRPG